MNYQLKGHDYRHAVEEMLLHLLPTETPVMVEAWNGDGCLSVLEETENTATASASFAWKGVTYKEVCEVSIADCSLLERRRRESESIRRSIYQAVAHTLAQPPAWGSLTGVRPAKLARTMMDRGLLNKEVAQELRQRYFVSAERASLTVRAAAVAQNYVQQLRPQDVSLYVGIPFCPSRCAYCSFVSASVDKEGALIAPYLDALCAEIEMTGKLLRSTGRSVMSIYIGGGTPTTLTAEQLTRLMNTLRRNVDFGALREYTVEAGRPDTITKEKLSAIKNGGATRISINPQTMNDAVLTRIGRRHSAAQVLESYAQAREIGFSCINMDTIAGLDGDTPESFAQTMDILIALKPENITVHTLAIKRAADLSDKTANAAKHDVVAVMLDNARAKLTKAAYAPYYLYCQKFSAGGFENVGWCQPGKEGIYNVCMMEELQTIVSLGAGAISKKVTGQGRITRYANPKYPPEYIASGEHIAAARAKLLDADGYGKGIV